jgi:hypothetical protein
VSLAPPPLIEGAATVAAVVLAGAAARSLASRMLPHAPSSLRLTGAAVIWAGMLYVAFRVLTAISVFGALPALALFAAIAWGAGAPRGEPLGAPPRSPWGWAIVPGVLVLLAGALRGAAAPPLGWDALTYHLARAGRWVHDGHAAILAAPDAWGYYEWFPRTGDSYWSWALLGMRDGGLLAAAGVAIVAGGALAAYAIARTMGARREGALLAAAAVVMTPAVANALTVAYVDNLVLALTLAGAALGIDALTRREGWGFALSGLALGLACATKYSMLQPLAGAALVVAFAAGLRRAALFAGAAAVPLVLECADRWILAGSPVWPFRLALAGREIFPGNEELVALLQGKLALPGQAVFDPAGFLGWLLSPGRHEFAQSLGVGPVMPVLAAIALIAFARAAHDRARRAPALFALAVAVLTVTATLGEDNLALRTLWAQTYARFTMPAFAIAIVAAASVDAWWSRGALALHALLGAALAWPHGWSGPDANGAARAVVPAALGAALAWATWRISRRLPPALRLPALALAASLPALLLLPGIRAGLRYEIYERASRPAPAFDMHELNRDYVAAWPLWRALDEKAPHRIAVAAGWDGTGHNTYLFPLLGSRLQNEIVYVPPSRDGRAIDYRRGEELSAAASHEAWTQGLESRRVDAFVALAPPPPERAAWIERDPAHFEALAASADGSSAAWRVYPPGRPGPPP